MKRKRFILILKRNIKPDSQEDKHTKEIKQLQIEVHNTLLESIKRLEESK